MSIYAYVYNNQIVEFKEIPAELYSNWITSGNPKKDCYRLLIDSEPPALSSLQIAEFSYQINSTTVSKVWTVRNKTADELRKTWTAYEFLLRFTAQERAAFRAVALNDPLVADFQQLAQAAQEIISDDPMTIAGMNYLVSIGLITEQRKNEILS